MNASIEIAPSSGNGQTWKMATGFQGNDAKGASGPSCREVILAERSPLNSFGKVFVLVVETTRGAQGSAMILVAKTLPCSGVLGVCLQ